MINAFCYFLPSLTTLVQIVLNKPTLSPDSPAQRVQPGARGAGDGGCTDAQLRDMEQLFLPFLSAQGRAARQEGAARAQEHRVGLWRGDSR